LVNKKTKKRAIIISELNNGYNFPINHKPEEVIVLNNEGPVIIQPYGNVMRSIIHAVFTENITEIYLIGENANDHLVSKVELQRKMHQAGISNTLIDTIEYIDVVNNNLLDWIVGPNNRIENIQQTINVIQNHPLLPKNVSVHGFMVCRQTQEMTAVF
jgi:carbonic anhydrase